jgi:NAD(P)H-nitrite reductase large subunit
MTMKHLIIGSGPAGVVAAEHIRKYDGGAQVTLIGDEPEPPYSRMAIPYYLTGAIQEQGTHLRRDAGWFDARSIEVRQGRVAGLDVGGSRARLEGGEELSYDRLLVATGSHPVRPPVPGIELDGVVSCWTLDDARRIAAVCQPGKRIVLMGAGFIGCIVLEALASSGVDLTVVEMQNRMVPRMMNELSGGLIKQWCEGKGVSVLTSTSVEAIEPDGGGLRVKLSSGESVTADLVITAAGVRPNVEFLEGSGIDVKEGVLVDRHMRSNADNVFAAGDVCRGYDFSTGGFSVHAIQPTAADHGRVAASNMVGLAQEYSGSINMNVLDTMGLVSCSFGQWMGVAGGDKAELADAQNFRYVNLQFADDVLVGASTLGMTDHVGVMRGLIQSRVHLKQWKDRLLKDPTRIMEAYLASVQSIGHNAYVL